MLENIPISKLRVFNNVFTIREKQNVLDESIYMKKNIYTLLPIEKLIELSINKKIKQKVYKVAFRDNTGDIKKYKTDLLEEYYKDN
jgi:hypothetical protein